MRFDKPVKALMFWWQVLQTGGVPIAESIYEDEEVHGIQTSRRAWTPSNLLCMYHDIGRTLENLTPSDRSIIRSYLLDIVGYITNKGARTSVTAYHGWRHKRVWSSVMRRLWRALPSEYKYHVKRQGKSIAPKGDSILPRRTRGHYLPPTPHREVEGVQSRLPLAGVVG